MFDTTQTQSQESGVYQVLARRTRPQSFSDLIGQEIVSTALSSMIDGGVIPHAFLFTGTRGTGKTSSARILAKSLCCASGPTKNPCQTCVHCKKITACAHDDILEIDAASNTGVDNIRDLREAAQFYPNSARYKVYIIDEVHMLSMSAFNALLKTLEEPPANVIFILATTELHKVPLTVRSRCVVFSFRKIAPETIASHLANILEKENVSFEPDALALIAREAKGSMRDSLSLLEQAKALCGNKHIDLTKTREALSILGQELAEKLLAAITRANATEALEILRTADSASVDLSTLLEDTAALFKSALILSQCRNDTDARRLTQLLPSEMDALRVQTEQVSASSLSEIFRLLTNSAREISRATTGLAWAEIAILDAISRRDWLSASELLGAISSTPSAAAAVPQPALTPRPAFLPPKPVEPKPASMQAPSPTMPAPAAPAGEKQPTVNTASTQQSSAEEAFQRVLADLSANGGPTPIRIASKLSQIKIVHCNEKLIQFNCAGELIQDLTENESKIFLAALAARGLGNAEIKGLHVVRGATSGPTGLAHTTRPAESIASSQRPETQGRSVASYEKEKVATEKQNVTNRVLNSPHVKAWAPIGTNHELVPVEDDDQ